ncbi:MAG: YMGG-like glycine zipper-containing protein [Ferruginibacter sp.]
MKKTLLILTMSTTLFACKNNGNKDTSTDKNMVLMDTSLLRRSGLLSDTPKVTVVVPVKVTPKATGIKNPANNTSAGTSTPANENTTATPEAVKRDRALSDAAIGTAIGAGSGAIIGAVVSKDKVKGAVIGGVVGGVGGYAAGRARDVKSGRVARKNQ